MSRIGRMPVAIPAGVTVTIGAENVITVKGPKGTLTEQFPAVITFTQEGNEVHVKRPDDEKETRSLHGLSRALLHNSPVYIFDEATSNIDVESENDIMRESHTLAKTKTVILISHRLANVIGSNAIYVMENGNIAESGTHEELLKKNSTYANLWNAQAALENYGKDDNLA